MIKDLNEDLRVWKSTKSTYSLVNKWFYIVARTEEFELELEMGRGKYKPINEIMMKKVER